MNSNTEIVTRDAAQERRLKRYFTGVLCKRGHLAERYTSTGACVSCLLRTVEQEAKPQWRLYLPAKPFAFDEVGMPPGSEAEAQAVFRYMADKKMHLDVLALLRADPKLMAHYDHERTLAEKFEAGR
jgi:hypothetical protein